jgi:hypothetical protein
MYTGGDVGTGPRKLLASSQPAALRARGVTWG